MASAPEARRQALKDRRPLLPAGREVKLDCGFEDQVAAMIATTGGDEDEDILQMQAKAG